MGRSCACGARRSGDYEAPCICDTEGWTIAEEGKPFPKPSKDGVYLVRYCDNGGDCYEDNMEFSIKPYRIDRGYFGTNEVPIHWKEQSWDDNWVYAWKEISQ